MLNLAQLKSAIGCLGKHCYSYKDTFLATVWEKVSCQISVCMQQVYEVHIYIVLTWEEQASHIHTFKKKNK